MTNESDNLDELTRYLLDELPEAERAALEQRYFADPALFARLQEVENDLLDDAAQGRLSPARKHALERRYASTPHLRERLRFAGEFRAALPLASPSIAVSWQDRIRAWLALPFLAWAPAAVVLLLLVFSLWSWRSVRQSRRELAAALAAQQQEAARRQDLEAQLAAERQRRAAPPAPSPVAPAIATIVLRAGGLRDSRAQTIPRLVIPPEADQVRLQLTIPEDDYRAYEATLQRVGRSVFWQQRNLRPQRIAGGVRFTFHLPKSILQNGEFLLSLRGVTAQGDIDDVSQSLFHIEKR